MNRNVARAGIWWSFLCANGGLVAALVAGQVCCLLTPGLGNASEPYEAYYRYIYESPKGKENGWSDNGDGLTHDPDHWFITQRDMLWKIPVTHGLNEVDCGDAGVACQRFDDWPTLRANGFCHMGDPEYYQGFLFVPMEGGDFDGCPDQSATCPAVAVFSADDLRYIDFACLNLEPTWDNQKHDAPWLAIDPGGILYSSDFAQVSPLFTYAVAWETLKTKHQLHLLRLFDVYLRDESGAFVAVNDVQGGVISPSGDRLYVTAGTGDVSRPGHGIHVFDLSTNMRVQYSTNGYGMFNFTFTENCPDPYLGDCPAYQEPEGITIWDLDDGRAPGILGQLHVMLINKGALHDEVFLKHYSGTIHVGHPGQFGEYGIPGQPFGTFGQANDLAWDGARISIDGSSGLESSTYPGPALVTKRVLLQSSGGPAAIR